MTLSTPIKFIYRPAHSKVHVELVCSCGSGHPQQCRCSPQLKTYPRSSKEPCSNTKKQQAISLFGSGTALARALGISKSAVSQWPEQLPQRTVDEINGAAIRLGKIRASEIDARNEQAA